MAPSTSSEKSFSEYGALESGDDAPTTVRDLVANGTLGADSFSVGEHQEDLTEVDEGKTRELFGSMHLSGHLALHHEFHVSFEADTSYTEESYEREEEFRAAAAAHTTAALVLTTARAKGLASLFELNGGRGRLRSQAAQRNS